MPFAYADVLSGALVVTGWHPDYPDNQILKGKRPNTQYFVLPQVYTALPLLNAWQPTYPDFTAALVTIYTQGQVLVVAPDVPASGVECIEIAAESFSCPALLGESITQSGMIDETLWTAQNIQEGIC